MAALAVIVKMRTKPGRRAETVDVFGRYIAGLDDEEGTQLYVLAEDTGDPDVLWLYEHYSDGPAAEAHLADPGYAEAMAALTPLMSARPEVTLVNPVRAKGAPSVPTAPA